MGVLLGALFAVGFYAGFVYLGAWGWLILGGSLILVMCVCSG